MQETVSLVFLVVLSEVFVENTSFTCLGSEMRRRRWEALVDLSSRRVPLQEQELLGTFLGTF